MNYSALTAAWNSSIQPPSGVSGTALTSAMTTQQKVTAVNGWTVTTPPIPMIIPTYKVYNLIVPSEFNALTSTNQQLVRDILGMGTVDSSSGTQVRARIVSIFPSSTTTFANLSNLASAYDTPPPTNWCLSNSYPTIGTSAGNLSVSDANNAGLV